MVAVEQSREKAMINCQIPRGQAEKNLVQSSLSPHREGGVDLTTIRIANDTIPRHLNTKDMSDVTKIPPNKTKSKLQLLKEREQRTRAGCV